MQINNLLFIICYRSLVQALRRLSWSNIRN